MSYERKKSLIGYVFISSWIIGFFLLYLKPLVQSFVYTFHKLTVTIDGFKMDFVGIHNFHFAFYSDPDFIKNLMAALNNLLYQVPIIIVFSLIMALMLNQKFRGRMIIRAIFFLPVVIASGVVINVINGDVMSTVILSGEKSSQLFNVSAFYEMLNRIGLNQDFVNVIVSTANNIFELSWKSGIQIVLFLAGLQVVSPSLYEAASIDGGTKWEVFWFVTFPMLTPILIVTAVYTIIDNFTDFSNPVMKSILQYGSKLNFAYSSTLAWIYFAVIGIILTIVFLIFNRFIIYTDE